MVVEAGNGSARRAMRGTWAGEWLHHASMPDLGDKVTWVLGERDATCLHLSARGLRCIRDE